MCVFNVINFDCLYVCVFEYTQREYTLSCLGLIRGRPLFRSDNAGRTVPGHIGYFEAQTRLKEQDISRDT